MNTESEHLRDKDRIIQIQQDYIDNLKQQLEELKRTWNKGELNVNCENNL